MPPVFKQSWEIRAATETSSMVNPKCWKIMSASLYLCASGQNMKWTCLLSNCKIVTFWTFLSDFWTIIMHPGLVFVSAVFVSFFLTARTTGLFLDENSFFFFRECSLQTAEKNQKIASKVTKLGNKSKSGHKQCVLQKLQSRHHGIQLYSLNTAPLALHSVLLPVLGSFLSHQEHLLVGDVPLYITWPQRLFLHLTLNSTSSRHG